MYEGQKDLFAENMKKAFMKGVCTLNLEAMTMFHSGGGSVGEAVGHSSSDSTWARNREPNLSGKQFFILRG